MVMLVRSISGSVFPLFLPPEQQGNLRKHVFHNWIMEQAFKVEILSHLVEIIQVWFVICYHIELDQDYSSSLSFSVLIPHSTLSPFLPRLSTIYSARSRLALRCSCHDSGSCCRSGAHLWG